jgi:hypothetical protein
MASADVDVDPAAEPARTFVALRFAAVDVDPELDPDPTMPLMESCVGPHCGDVVRVSPAEYPPKAWLTCRSLLLVVLSPPELPARPGVIVKSAAPSDLVAEVPAIAGWLELAAIAELDPLAAPLSGTP